MTDRAKEFYDQVTASKMAYRKMLADLPIGEKLKLMEEMCEREWLLKSVRDADQNLSRSNR